MRVIDCNKPEANDLTVGIMALVAHAEREAISRRTKRHWRWRRRGGWGNSAVPRRFGGKGGAAQRATTVARNAEAHARDLAPVLADLRAQGVTSLRGIADALNDRGMLTRRGGRWGVSDVRNLMARQQAAP